MEKEKGYGIIYIEIKVIHEKEINKLKQMIMSEFYIENRKSLIDTLVSHGKYAKMVLLDIIDNRR